MIATWGFQGAQELINIHPIFVHFPIAFLLGAAAFYLLGSIFRRESLLAAGKWSLFAGALTAMITVWTGLQAEDTVAHDEEVHQIMMKHQTLGIIVLIMSMLLSFWVAVSKANIPTKRRGLFFAALFLLGMIILQQADFGGRMVFLKGVGVGRKSMMTEMVHHHDEHHEHHHSE